MKFKLLLLFMTGISVINILYTTKFIEKEVHLKNDSLENSSLIVWTGTDNDNWNDPDNWSPNQVPNSSSDVQISSSSNNPSANGNITINSLELLSTTSLIFKGNVTFTGNVILNSNSTLETRGKATMEATVTIHPNACLFSKGGLDINHLVLLADSCIDANGKDIDNYGTTEINSTATVTNIGSLSNQITYKTPISDPSKWHLISSPVNGQRIDNFIMNNNLALGSGTTPNQNVGLAYFDNDLTSGSSWVYYTDGYDGNEEFNFGDSYAIKLAATGDATFTGNISLNDVNFTIHNGNDNSFNLLGNPFIAWLPTNSNANASNNILTNNAVNLDVLEEATIWYWNPDTENYIAINMASDTHFMKPGESFFVKSKSSSNATFEIPSSMQTNIIDANSTARTSENPKIKLEVQKENNKRYTEIIYVPQATIGFDNGYDSTLFDGQNNSFAVYTALAENSGSKNLSIQSLPNNNYEHLIIPVGLNAITNSEVTFKIKTRNLPRHLAVYLEDRALDVFSLLSEQTATYSVTLNQESNGIGRFYIHTISNTLSVNTVNFNTIHLYTTHQNNLQIVGLNETTKANLKIYDLKGNQVFKRVFEAKKVNTIRVPSVESGIYIIKLLTDSGILTKKIVFE